MELAPLTVLNKRFTVKRTLQDPGPYDIAYLGEDVDGKDAYVIREFFPTDLVKRASGTTSVEVKSTASADLYASGREYFQKESEVLAELRHRSLPSGYVHFDANGTTYRARPRTSGLSLAEGLNVKGTLSEKAALTIMIPVLEGLMEAHGRGLYHGGVSPEVIRLLEDGSVLLTGFQGAFIQLAREQGELSRLVRSGTSAIEQYTPRGNQGPWTDVYAVAATITQIVTGQDVPKASQRLEGDDPLSVLIQDADAFSTPGVREALIDALTVDPSKRLQSAEALRDALKDSSTRYDEDQTAYSILPVEPEADASSESEEDVEVLSTHGEDRPARASAAASASSEAAPDSSSPESPSESPAPPSDEASAKASAKTSASEESSSEESSSEQSSASLVAWVVGLPLLIFALGGATWFMMLPGGASAGGDESEPETSAAASTPLRARADSLYQNAEYQEARRAYRQVLQRRGDDQEVQRRLSRIDQMMAESSDRRYQQALARGDSLKRRADSLLAEGEGEQANTVYSRAMAAYFSALDVRTGDAVANQKISQVERRQESIARQQATGGSGTVDVTQIVQFFQTQAETQLKEGNLQAALRKYRQAADYAEDNQKLNQIIADLEQEIQQQARTEAYERAYERGMQLLQEEQFAEAKVELKAALDVDSTQEARSALRRVDRLLTKEKSKREQTYASYRSAGDRALERESLQTALQAYREALGAKPGDRYAQQQIEKVKAQQENSPSGEPEKGETGKKDERVGPDGVYRIVDQDPKPKGGVAALHRGVAYPDRAARNGIEGRVYVKALIGEDGQVQSADVARGIGGGCDQEALRVVRQTEFIPAKVDGQPVPTHTTVWIQFSLGGDQ